MIANYEKEGVGKDAVVRMFCSYCRRSLENARTDIMRAQARRSKRERLFSDMRDAELNRLTAPCPASCREAVFDAGGMEVVVADPDIAAALRKLDDHHRAVILLGYFAEWSDRAIGTHLGVPRSTVQFRRTRALRILRALLEGGGSDDL